VNTTPQSNPKPREEHGDPEGTEGIGSEGGPTDEDEAKALDDVKERTSQDRKRE
jgi:hypothetical protein